MTADPYVVGPNTAARHRRDRRARRAAWLVAALVLLLAAFVVVTSSTGFPGPGPLRRYRTDELQAVADRINESDCGQGTWGSAPIASVDRLRSRVHLATPWAVVVASEDRPLIENPPPGPTSTGLVTMVRCVGHSGPG